MTKYEIELNALESSYIMWMAMNTGKKESAIIKDIIVSTIAKSEIAVLTSQLRKGANES